MANYRHRHTKPTAAFNSIYYHKAEYAIENDLRRTELISSITQRVAKGGVLYG